MVNMLQDTTSLTDDTCTTDALLRLNAAGIVTALDDACARWHTEVPPIPGGDHLLAMHRANFVLWHLEDDARSVAASADQIATVKRSIDRVNQERNDHAEAVDVDLLAILEPLHLPHKKAPLHSETPGQILDRLSILSLKRFHTAEECRRQNVDNAHRERNRTRLLVLDEQSEDLSACLQELWGAVVRGERQFKRYRQLKMYNDPALNPVLYGATDKPVRSAS